MFYSLAELVQQAQTRSLPLWEIILEGEMKLSDEPRPVIWQRMSQRLQVMRHSASQGLETPLHSISGLTRGSAHRFWSWLENGAQPLSGPLLSRAMARALSISETNACMGCIVATPTAGAAGILPAVLLTLQEQRGFSDEQLIQALFTAGGVGVVIVHRAHVSGAAGGCQAETGSAAAMTAAATVELLGGSPAQASHAAAIALKNKLGQVCEPIAGLVAAPCTQSNAAAVAQALVAADLAMAGVESLIPADEVIDAMRHIGNHMDERLRETAEGGLAATPSAQQLAQQIWSKRNEF
jgi:L-serine dehydratase